MKTPIHMTQTRVAIAVGLLSLAACSTTPIQSEGANNARSRLTQLQSDPQLANRAPVAIQEAEEAVVAAEKPQTEVEMAEHLVYMADRKIEIAKTLAQSRLLVDQREMLNQQSASARLDSRTHEVESARKQAEELQRQIAELNAKTTERGLVVTLGDLLFDTGRARLKRNAASNLIKLANFLNQHLDRSVLIEGHADSVGGEAYNQDLSQRRANSVKIWLEQQGVDPRRLVAFGKGEDLPVADNNSASGRQLNRRVEVVIENPSASTTSSQ